MPRSVVLSEGGFWVGWNVRGAIADLYFPNLDTTHVGPIPIRSALWDGHRLYWLDQDDWEIHFPGGTNRAAAITFRHHALHVRIEMEAQMLDEGQALVQRWHIHDHSGHPRQLRFFVSEDLRLGGNPIGDTTFFDPDCGLIVHHKGSVAFGLGGESEHGGIRHFACGEKGFTTPEGSWKDAEDGWLSGHPIAQGDADSTFGLDLELPANGSTSCQTWIVVRRSFLELKSVDWAAVRATTYAATSTHDLKIVFPGLWPEWGRELDASLHVLCNHQDLSGAWVAASDSDVLRTGNATYNYCWMRDGCRIAELYMELGQTDSVERFLQYCIAIKDRHPAYLQKYTVHGEVGASWHPRIRNGVRMNPIQIDETAEVISLACRWLDEGYGTAQSRSAVEHQLVDAYLPWLEVSSASPLAPEALGYDLWEERYGWHTYSQWTLVKALRWVAKLKGDSQWSDCASQLLDRLRERVTQGEGGGLRIARTLFPSTATDPEPDWTPDASLLLAWADLVPYDTDLAQMDRYVNPLRVHSWVGGLARYPNDWYYRQSDAYPGSPWVITTLWEFQVRMARAKTRAELMDLTSIFGWLRQRSYGSAMLSEQLHPDTGFPLSVGPLVWSHAEVLATGLAWEKAAAAMSH